MSSTAWVEIHLNLKLLLLLSVDSLCPTFVLDVSISLRPHGLQHLGFPVLQPSPRVCSNSCPLSPWYHPTISSSVAPFSSCLWSFPASGSFPMSWLFASSGQSIGASGSVFPMNIQDWFLRGLIDWFDLLAVQRTLKNFLQHHTSKSSIVQSSAFFMVQLSHPYMTTGITIALTRPLPTK